VISAGSAAALWVATVEQSSKPAATAAVNLLANDPLVMVASPLRNFLRVFIAAVAREYKVVYSRISTARGGPYQAEIIPF
jgi:hypothetical protein